jgi:hypothetical protein
MYGLARLPFERWHFNANLALIRAGFGAADHRRVSFEVLTKVVFARAADLKLERRSAAARGGRP